MIPAVRAILEKPLTDTQINARLRHVPARSLVRSLKDAMHSGLVRPYNWTAASDAFRFAIDRGASTGDIAAIAGHPRLDEWSRASAACALLARERLSEHHAPPVLESLVFGLLNTGEWKAAGQAAIALAATGVSPEVIRRVDSWRALSGLESAVFWKDADRFMNVKDATGLEQELAFRAWVTPPNGLCGFTVLVEIALRGGPAEARSALVVLVQDAMLDSRFRPLCGPLGEAIADQVAMGAIEAPVGEVGALLIEASGHSVELLETLATPPRVIAPIPVTLDEAVALLQRPATGATWYFDAMDTEGMAPEDDEATLLRLTDRPAVRDRCLAAARSLARWYLWKGDEASAGAMAWLGGDAPWRSGPLAQALLRVSQRDLALPAERAPNAPPALRVGRIADPDAYLKGLAEALSDVPLGWAETAVRLSAELHGVSPLAWSPEFLRLYLLLLDFPQHGTALQDDAAIVLADLRRFVTAMGERWGLQQADTLIGVLDTRFEPKLAVALADESRWTEPKAEKMRARRRRSTPQYS